MVSLGFVGGGFVAQIAHLPSFKSIDGVSINCLADPFRDLGEHLSRVYSIDKYVVSHLDLPDASVLDGVVVTLPRRLSYGVLRDLITCSHTILTEKPLCLDLVHAEHLLALSTEYTTGLSVGYMRRHDPAVSKFKRLVDEISRDSLVSINAICHMGNSYANPFDSKKGLVSEKIQYDLEDYPEWLDERLHTAYEQFLNVFSHITDLVEFILGDRIKLVDHSINTNGEGLVLARVGNTPIVFDLMRGKQHKWRESITINTHCKMVRLVLGPAFLRNSPGTVEIESGKESIDDMRFTPDWGWAFRNQALSFIHSLKEPEFKVHDTLKSAVRQISLAEAIFRTI